MAEDKYQGGCVHVTVYSDAEPIDNHECHCNVCKSVIEQHTTHVVFFSHGDVKASEENNMKRVPFNSANPDGPLEICLCKVCAGVLIPDDKDKRIRVAVPNVMNYDPAPDYHSFWDETKGYPKPDDGRPVYLGLCPDFVWPARDKGLKRACGLFCNPLAYAVARKISTFVQLD